MVSGQAFRRGRTPAWVPDAVAWEGAQLANLARNASDSPPQALHQVRTGSEIDTGQGFRQPVGRGRSAAGWASSATCCSDRRTSTGRGWPRLRWVRRWGRSRLMPMWRGRARGAGCASSSDDVNHRHGTYRADVLLSAIDSEATLLLFLSLLVLQPVSTEAILADTVQIPFDFDVDGPEGDALDSWAGCAAERARLLTPNTADSAETIATAASMSCTDWRTSFLQNGGRISAGEQIVIQAVTLDVLMRRAGISEFPPELSFDDAESCLMEEEGALTAEATAC